MVDPEPRLAFAIAERYASEGFLVYVLLRRTKMIRFARAAMQSRGLPIKAMACNPSSIASMERALQVIKQQSGRCDVLIYNAMSMPSTARAVKSETLFSRLQVNLIGAFAFISRILDEMKARENGAIIFSTCRPLQRESTKQDPWGIGNIALRALVERLARDVEPDGIRVGMITVDGGCDRQEFELNQIAQTFWQLFVTSDRSCPRQLHFGISI